ncbi:MAG: bifunctional oligoribonuclease/PAP phosphatase NrnA [Chloroflexi bacterium]|nr:bifunctional oligoribonuclease/PAP phosphatase NrnA [Chloroflexota bacterium]
MDPSSQNEQVRQLLHRAQSVVIASHISPDGDAVGSLLGLGWALRQAGKHVTLALADPVPENLRFLPGVETIQPRAQSRADVVITVDCGSRDRVGSALPEDWPVDVNIDHHKSNTHFGRYNIVYPDAPSTTAVLAEHLPVWDLPLTQDAALALLTGLITDTLGFRAGTVRPDTLRLAARLMEAGADISLAFYEAMVAKSFAMTRYLGIGQSRAQLLEGIVWSYLTRADREETGFSEPDDAGLVNVLLNVREANISVVFIELDEPGLIKVSWRAKAGWDVGELARSFGGGGHTAAAGARVPGSLDEVRNRVLARTLAFYRTGTV